ncbi:hypothetical protein IPM62_03365 [Candidatus Woesebacteria bacterium]|nr:MAG: hypothetical protein IPM62_03365 [Candidatus Woesebacteria bacterium]
MMLWVANSALLFSASLLFPAHFTLGNNLFTPIQAAIFTGFVWNYILWQIEPTFTDLEIKVKGQTNMALVYLVINFVSLWTIARMAFAFGFGISSYVWVFILSAIANFVQYTVWTKTEKAKK